MPLIREAREGDYPQVEEIGKLTWEGHDYLPDVFHRWLKDGNFYVLEEEGRVVGTAKLTLLPCGVGWMEGLRIHPSFRGRGLSWKLHNFLLSLGRKMSSEGKLRSLMYATYVRNDASRHLGERTGFRIVGRFYHLLKEARVRGVELTEIEPDLPDLDLIPVGWRFIRRCDGTLEWLRANTTAYSVDCRGFLVSKDPHPSFTPMDYSRVEEVVAGMEEVASRMGTRVSLMIPGEMGDIASRLKKMGFSQWELDEPDILVLELILSRS